LEKCVGCQFYDRSAAEAEDKGVRWGKCRRSVPIVHPVAAKAYMVEGIWPHVRDDDWCGEWSAMKPRRHEANPDPMNLMLPSNASPIRTSSVPGGSLMTSVSAASEPVSVPIAGRFGSD